MPLSTMLPLSITGFSGTKVNTRVAISNSITIVVVGRSLFMVDNSWGMMHWGSMVDRGMVHNGGVVDTVGNSVMGSMVGKTMVGKTMVDTMSKMVGSMVGKTMVDTMSKMVRSMVDGMVGSVVT